MHLDAALLRLGQAHLSGPEIGERLDAALEADESYEILDEIAGGTWTAGGCWLLAATLAEILGLGSSALFALVDAARNPKAAQHVVLAYGGGYLDGDGWSTEEQLLFMWRNTEGLEDPRLIPLASATTNYLVNRPAPRLKAYLEQALAS